MYNNPAKVLISSGEKVAKAIGATAYVECSALTGENLTDVFETAIRAAIKPKKKPKK